jgi:hypothetical protein
MPIEANNNMTSKITAILAAALVLASAGVASAATSRHAGAQWLAPYVNSFYDSDYWLGIHGDAPYETPRPYGGTVFEGVAPY